MNDGGPLPSEAWVKAPHVAHQPNAGIGSLGVQLQREQPLGSVVQTEWVPAKQRTRTWLQGRIGAWAGVDDLTRGAADAPAVPPTTSSDEQAPSPPQACWPLAMQSRQTAPSVPQASSAVPSTHRSAQSQQPLHVLRLQERALGPLFASSATCTAPAAAANPAATP